MPNVVIQPAADKASRRHFIDTIEHPVPLARLAPHLSEEHVRALRNIYGERGIPTWGATPAKDGSNVVEWNKLAQGDLVLFMRDKHVFTIGTITYKLRSPELAQALWSTKPDGQVFEYAFFLADIHTCQVPYSVVRTAAGYKEGWNPLGFSVISDHRAATIATAVLGARSISAGPTRTPSDTDHRLALVRHLDDIRSSVMQFNAETDEATASLLMRTTLWVYDPQLDIFAPSKYAGIQHLSLADYRGAQGRARTQGRLSGFEGHRSRAAIERALQRPFASEANLAPRLLAWAEDLAGQGALTGASQDKWRFISLETAPARTPRARRIPPRLNPDMLVALRAAQTSPKTFEDPNGDSRQRVVAEIVRRQGQPVFRRMLLAAYSGRCAISGCDVLEVVEAAHIRPYRGPLSNHPTNGVPLRSDLHALFDLGLLAIEPSSYTVVLSPGLRTSAYGTYHGRSLSLPADARLCPDRDALADHRARAGL